MPTQGERLTKLEIQFDLTIQLMKKKIDEVHDTLYKNGALGKINALAEAQDFCKTEIAEIKKSIVQPKDDNGNPIDRRDSKKKIDPKKWTRTQKISVAAIGISLLGLSLTAILEKLGQFINWLILVLK